MFTEQATIFEMQAELCRAMSNAIRLEIIHLLREGAKHLCDLALATGRPQTTISRHLATLRNAGIIISLRQGQESSFQIANPKIVSVCDLMRQVLAEQALHNSEMMKAVEDEPVE